MEVGDEHVQCLLKMAESRLAALETRAQMPSQCSKPFRSNLNPISKSHTTMQSNLARTNNDRLLDFHGTESLGKTQHIEDPVILKLRSTKIKKSSVGLAWSHLPRTDLTPSLQRDLKILQMRHVLDTKRHYKRDSRKGGFPEFSQIGSVIEGPTEYLSSRFQRKERRPTIASHELASEAMSGRLKAKYGEIQSKKSRGRKRH